MELNFLGRGNAFNTKEGNTSAYFTENKILFLIDCGESVFAKIQSENLLDKANGVVVFLTHSHSDHCGSLGSLIFYNYLIKNIITKVCVGPDSQKEIFTTLLSINGIDASMYQFISTDELTEQFFSFDSVDFVETPHTQDIKAFSIIFHTEDGIVFYSGDTNSTENLENVINSGEEIDKIFIECNENDSPITAHLSANKIAKVIPEELASKTYCMHVSGYKCITEITRAGFNVVQVTDKNFILHKLQRKLMS